jgi:hypothetical protein
MNIQDEAHIKLAKTAKHQGTLIPTMNASSECHRERNKKYCSGAERQEILWAAKR